MFLVNLRRPLPSERIVEISQLLEKAIRPFLPGCASPAGPAENYARERREGSNYKHGCEPTHRFRCYPVFTGDNPAAP
ncbi:MAG TPA: hypothetical protein VG144_05570 [Gaiellaceae bacterium]|nr:hypothetical protein [Gaiellaceae bacterium]